jgi:hypothetical protein
MGTSGMCTNSATYPITLSSPLNTAPTLISPANNATNTTTTPLLDWQSIAGVIQYEYQVAYDNAFTMLETSGIASYGSVSDRFTFIVQPALFLESSRREFMRNQSLVVYI